MTSTTPGDDETAREASDAAAEEATDASAQMEAHTAGTAEPVGDTTEPAPEPVIEPADEGDEASDEHPTARLDAAVERAAAVGAEPAEAEAPPAPVPADSVRRETYVPAASVAAGTTAGAATLAPEPVAAPLPTDVAAPAPQTIYVQAPQAPKTRGNRGFGVLVALIGTVLFAALYLGAAYLLLLTQGGAEAAAEKVAGLVPTPAYWVPVAVFFLAFALLAAIVNRGGWWAYAVFGLFVGVAVYLSYVGGALWTVAWSITPEEVSGFVAQRWLDPLAIVAGVIAREIPIWLGGWIAARGRSVTERNRLAYEAYERELAAGPQAR